MYQKSNVAIFCIKIIPILAYPDLYHLLQHGLKKHRNSMLKCGTTKNVTLNGHSVLWKHWTDAYMYDVENHGMRIYHKLTLQHVELLDSSQKMRNKLAFEVLDSKMLNLMKVCTVFKIIQILSVPIIKLCLFLFCGRFTEKPQEGQT